jgi:hypothetical protein
MKKPIRLIKRLLSLIALGSLSVILAACYGSVAIMNSIAVTVKGKTSGNAIPDIRVSVTDVGGNVLNETTTDAAGQAMLDYAPSTSDSDTGQAFFVTATDVDGAANGTYAEQRKQVPAGNQSLDFEL